MLGDLCGRGVRRLLVEGGAGVHRAFLGGGTSTSCTSSSRRSCWVIPARPGSPATAGFRPATAAPNSPRCADRRRRSAPLRVPPAPSITDSTKATARRFSPGQVASRSAWCTVIDELRRPRSTRDVPARYSATGSEGSSSVAAVTHPSNHAAASGPATRPSRHGLGRTVTSAPSARTRAPRRRRRPGPSSRRPPATRRWCASNAARDARRRAGPAGRARPGPARRA